MSHHLPFNQLTHLRDDAQLIAEQASDQEQQLEALLALAERDLSHAKAAMANATDLDVDQVRHLFAAELQRSTTAAALARRLSVVAHLQQGAVRQLMAHLVDGRSAGGSGANTVLVVDDYSDIRDVLAGVLEGAGFVVRTATNGLEAVIAAYETRPDVIVMDVTMPVLDGLEATRLIKAGQATRNARVIAYTGSAAIDESPLRTLFAAVVQKPSTPECVLAAVQSVGAR